jgi:transcription elongation GreA/GreB family factor
MAHALNKTMLVVQIVARLADEVEAYARSARATQAEATDEQSQPENKYDTRGLEAAYLAHGQSRQAAEAEEAIEAFRALPLREFAPGEAIDLGALVELDCGGERTFYFIGPRAGGTEIEQDQSTILVITPQSPLGTQLMGARESDSLQIEIGGVRNNYRVISVA